MRGIYTHLALRARADGEDAYAPQFALDQLLADLLATLVRDNVSMIERLTIRDIA